MKYKSYSEYVEAAKAHFSAKKDLKVPVELMILPEELFNNFKGVIEFGPGGKNLVNKKCKCSCKEKCKNHDKIEG